MRVKVWGARGSVPAPGPEMNRYGGNTSCVRGDPLERRDADPRRGHRHPHARLRPPPDMPRINILLTHLHLDHIQGLMFFPPCFRAESTITDLGARARPRPRSRRGSPATSRRRSRRSRSASCPCDVSFLDAPGQRVEDRRRDDPGRGGHPPRADARLPDHRRRHDPLLTSPTTSRRSARRSTELDPEWISGFNLARDADLLIHDCQYTDEEYPGHEGWGHSRDRATRCTFAKRVGAKRTLLFHHDPLHTDGFLDDLHAQRASGWAELGGDPDADRDGAPSAPS